MNMLFSKGVRIRHKIYGEGIVLRYHDYDMSYEVAFSYPYGVIEVYEDELEEIM